MATPEFEFQVLESPQNEKIKLAVRLREKRHRDKHGLFPVEGYRQISRADQAGRRARTIFFCPELYPGRQQNEWKLVARLVEEGARAFRVPPRLFQKIAYRDKPEGLLALHPVWPLAPLEKILENLPADPLLLVCERLEKPGNLGTLLRGADAVGCDGVVLVNKVTDIFNPNLVRASTGVFFSQRIAECSLEEWLEFCRSRRIRLVAAHPPDPENPSDGDYTRANLTGPLGIVLGSEMYGLSEEALKRIPERVHIPMMGRADSLNVALAGAILLFEARRQRNIS